MRSGVRKFVVCTLILGFLIADLPNVGNAHGSLSIAGIVNRPLLSTARKSSRPPLVVAYLGGQNTDAWITSLVQKRRLSWIITTNYSLVDVHGTLQGTNDPAVVDMAHRSGSKVQFRVANFVGGDFNREVAHAVLTRPVSRTLALTNILRVLDAYDYDGVNLDVENIPPGDRTALTLFTTALSHAVRSRGKTLSIAVPGKTGDQPNDGWSGAFDLGALSRVTDTVIVMAYDEHWSTSAPGPIAALPWVEAVVQYTARQVGSEKLLLGVAFYGYDWPKRGSAEGVTMRQAVSRADHARTPILWDTEGQVPYYKTAGRTVYFENASSIERKLSLATRQQLAGVAAWRLGHELPEVWDVLATYQTNPGGLTPRTLTRRSPVVRPTALLPELIRVPLAQQ